MNNLVRYCALSITLLCMAAPSFAADAYSDTSAAGSNTNLCDPTGGSSTSTSYEVTNSSSATALLTSLCESSNAGFNNISTMAASAKSDAKSTAEVLQGALGSGTTTSSTNIYG